MVSGAVFFISHQSLQNVGSNPLLSYYFIFLMVFKPWTVLLLPEGSTQLFTIGSLVKESSLSHDRDLNHGMLFEV